MKKPFSKKQNENTKILKSILELRENPLYKTYGSLRMTEELKSRGYKCSKNRIAKLMKENNIHSVTVKKYKATTNSKHSLPVAENILNQDFQAIRPNEKWVTDITYISTSEGWLYLAAILDLYNKKIVGWSVSNTMTKQLVIDALSSAVTRVNPPKGVIHHSDRGSQYCSHDYQKEMKKYGFISSMSRKGNCYDNACIESFWGTLKKELIYRLPLISRKAMKTELFKYIEIFYNRKRRHSGLNYLSPESFDFLENSA